MKSTVVRLLVAIAVSTSARTAAAEVTGSRSDEMKPGDETARALERALVRQGALVLRPWSSELEPGFSYVYREANAVRRDTIVGALAGRIGLPLSAQGDVRVPWVLLDRAPGFRSGSGLGDIELGVTKQLLVGAPATSIPDVLIAGRWKAPSGGSTGDLPAGTGAHSFQALLTAVGRDDPLVLVGSVYYVWNLRAGQLDRGDAAGVILRTLLAATPNTSLLIGVDAATVFATRSLGRIAPGSERLSAVLEIGLSQIRARDLFLNVTTGIGITPVAPDFQLSVALPFRL
jgi:hypothetical protein